VYGSWYPMWTPPGRDSGASPETGVPMGPIGEMGRSWAPRNISARYGNATPPGMTGGLTPLCGLYPPSSAARFSSTRGSHRGVSRGVGEHDRFNFSNSVDAGPASPPASIGDFTPERVNKAFNNAFGVNIESTPPSRVGNLKHFGTNVRSGAVSVDFFGDRMRPVTGAPQRGYSSQDRTHVGLRDLQSRERVSSVRELPKGWAIRGVSQMSNRPSSNRPVSKQHAWPGTRTVPSLSMTQNFSDGLMTHAGERLARTSVTHAVSTGWGPIENGTHGAEGVNFSYMPAGDITDEQKDRHLCAPRTPLAMHRRSLPMSALVIPSKKDAAECRLDGGQAEWRNLSYPYISAFRQDHEHTKHFP